MPTDKPNQSLKWIALLLAAGVVFLGSLSVQRRVAEFQPVGITTATGAASWTVTEVANGANGLVVGDQIVLANGAGPAVEPHLASILRAQAETELVVQRGAELIKIDYRLPPLQVDWIYILLCFVGIGYLVVGLYTILREQHRPALLFCLWCLAATTVYLFSAVAPFNTIGRTIYLVEEIARVLLAPLTLHLFWLFPTPITRRRKFVALIPFFYLPAAFILALQSNLIFFGGSWFGNAIRIAVPTIDRLVLLQLAAFSIAAITCLAWRLLTTRRSDHRRQVAWMVIGMTLGYLPFLFLYVIPHTVGFSLSTLLTGAAVLPLALVPITFAYAILRYKLWDIGGMVRDGISLSLTVLIGVLGFSLVNLALHRTVPEDLALARDVMTFVTGLLIAGVVLPANRRIGSSLQRLQYGSRFQKRRELADLGQDLLHERDLGELSNRLIEHLEEGLEIESAALFITRGQELIPTATTAAVHHSAAIPHGVIPGQFWREDVVPLSGVDFPSHRPALLQHFFMDGFRYLFPLTAQNQPIGLLAVGYKDHEVPLSSDDLDLLRRLLNQAALSLENAKLLHRVTEQLTEVTRLQEYNQGIIESSPVGIAVLDEGEQIMTANAAFERIVGATRAELTGSTLRSHLPISPLPTPAEGVREMSFCANPNVDLDTDSVGESPAEASERHLEVSTSHFLSPDGPQTVLVVRDISDEIALEAAMKEKERLASLGMLAAGVAHEVNTPITGISSYAQMLIADTDANDPRYETLRKVEKQTFRASRIVNSLLDFARKRSESDRISLVPLLEEVFELTGDRMERHGVELDWERPEEEFLLEADDGEIQQVVTNLVMNAIDAMRPQGGELSVRVEAEETQVSVHVQDSGPGIPPEALNKVFQPFFSTKQGEGGTGLGLSISYNIVERHGGALQVASPVGEGAHFTMTLPRVASVPEPSSEVN